MAIRRARAKHQQRSQVREVPAWLLLEKSIHRSNSAPAHWALPPKAWPSARKAHNGRACSCPRSSACLPCCSPAPPPPQPAPSTKRSSPSAPTTSPSMATTTPIRRSEVLRSMAQEGGNISVSTPTAGGSKSTCCASLYTPLPPDNSVHIKWTRDSKTWCEAKVPFSGPVPANPEYMEVHFYRDGHIEVAVTETSSPPRLKLERLHGNSRHQDKSMNVINDEKFARCQRGYF
ncbi:MAG: hypothetical protein CGU28_14280 [Candidatus Dactylopiibacterium carminicum]|nr:MAG: hypothetical protein CGU28_14280 [Candidatus Dactylopiibacterium carminicum]